jgi:hypothetical protein
MSILEVCAVVVAASMALVATSVVVGLIGFGRLRRRLDDMMNRLHSSLSSTDRLLEDVDGIVGNLRRLETRLQSNVEVVLNQVEPPVRTAAAVLAGVRSGLSSLLRGGSGTETSSERPDGSAA